MDNSKGSMIINGNVINKIHMKTFYFIVFISLHFFEHSEMNCFYIYFICNIPIDYHVSFGVIHQIMPLFFFKCKGKLRSQLYGRTFIMHKALDTYISSDRVRATYACVHNSTSDHSSLIHQLPPRASVTGSESLLGEGAWN